MNGQEIIEFACKGVADAERFCKSWLDFCHLIDDCADKDKPVDDQRLARVLVAYTMELAGNSFFQAHKAQLIGLMIQGANAWVDSNRTSFAGNYNELQRKNATDAVLKGFYHEVIYGCAFIVGGWEHLRLVTSKCREYNFEKEAV